MGLPDVTNYAIRIAETLAARLEADTDSRASSACYGSERKGR